MVNVLFPAISVSDFKKVGKGKKSCEESRGQRDSAPKGCGQAGYGMRVRDTGCEMQDAGLTLAAVL
jgi:hypothetical protein